MVVQPVLLMTDALIFTLVATTLFFVFWIRRDEQSLAPWREVLYRRSAMSAFVVLLFFVVIGVMDSIHFRVHETNGSNGHQFYSTQVYSVLDELLKPLGQQYEQSYSEPFASRSYSKSIIPTSNGDIEGYLPLKYAGIYSNASEKKYAHILTLSLKGLGYGVVSWLTIILLCNFVAGKCRPKCAVENFKKMFTRRDQIAWFEMAITFLLLLIISSICLTLSADYHILGTDKVGKDVFYQAVKGIRTGLVIGTVTTMVMLPFAIMLGAMAGYFRGWVDDVIQYIYTTLSSVPGVLLISASVLALQVYISNHQQSFATLESRADARLLALCLILGVTSWTSLCRLLRAETLKLREMDFVRASLSMGVKPMNIIMRHILPNIMHIVLITVVLDFSALVLAEAVLSYVGVGVDPTTLSWGNMINSARLDLSREPVVWWPLLSAFIFMFSLVLSANLFADAVRDAFDPRLRHVK